MQLSVSGKHLDVGDSLTARVQEALASVVERHFGKAIEGRVSFARVRHLYRADIVVHPARGMVVQSHGEAPDAHAAFDAAIQRLETRLHRYKGKLVERRRDAERDLAEPVQAQGYWVDAARIADDGGAEDKERGAPPIVAETTHNVGLMTLQEAVLRMDLADESVLLFRNKSHGGFGVLHRRPDGSIGWIDAGPLPRD